MDLVYHVCYSLVDWCKSIIWGDIPASVTQVIHSMWSATPCFCDQASTSKTTTSIMPCRKPPWQPNSAASNHIRDTSMDIYLYEAGWHYNHVCYWRNIAIDLYCLWSRLWNLFILQLVKHDSLWTHIVKLIIRMWHQIGCRCIFRCCSEIDIEPCVSTKVFSFSRQRQMWDPHLFCRSSRSLALIPGLRVPRLQPSQRDKTIHVIQPTLNYYGFWASLVLTYDTYLVSDMGRFFFKHWILFLNEKRNHHCWDIISLTAYRRAKIWQSSYQSRIRGVSRQWIYDVVNSTCAHQKENAIWRSIGAL